MESWWRQSLLVSRPTDSPLRVPGELSALGNRGACLNLHLVNCEFHYAHVIVEQIVYSDTQEIIPRDRNRNFLGGTSALQQKLLILRFIHIDVRCGSERIHVLRELIVNDRDKFQAGVTNAIGSLNG